MFSESATVELYLPAKSQISMSLYSVDGKKIMTLQDNAGLSSGLHHFDLNLSGSSLRSGIYFLELMSGGFRQTVKLVYNP
ncbi:MAG: T9SS type A sorting domain-containing protein [Bacteroidota bacterium]